MDPDLTRIHDNVRRIIDAGGPEVDILAYLKTEGFGSREAWLSAWDAERNPPAETVLPPPLPESPSIGPSGPTRQPAFPGLSPSLGGALDALVAYGTGLSFGGANLIPGMKEYNQELSARNPRTSTLLKGAGAAMALPVGTMAASAATGGARAVAGAGSSLLRNRLIQTLGKGGIGLYLLDKIMGRRINQGGN